MVYFAVAGDNIKLVGAEVLGVVADADEVAKGPCWVGANLKGSWSGSRETGDGEERRETHFFLIGWE